MASPLRKTIRLRAKPLVPVRLVHLRAVGLEPLDVAELALAAVRGVAGEEPAAAEHRVAAAQLDDAAEVNASRSAWSSSRSQSTQAMLVVLGSRRCCCRPGCGRARRRAASIGTPWLSSSVVEEVALLAQPQRVDLGVVGLTLDAAVPGPVVALAVVAALAVGLVVLLVVGHQVPQGEAVVGDDEVDRRDRLAAAVLVEVAASR